MKRSKSFCASLLKLAHDTIYDRSFQTEHKRGPADFTRSRKLGFTMIMQFLLKLVRKSLQVEVDEFYDDYDISLDERATMDAFIKARHKVLPSAFVDLFDRCSDYALRGEQFPTFNGYRVFAIDGSHLLFPANDDILKHLDPSPNDPNQAAARISLLCEVHSGYAIDAAIGCERISERCMAMQHLARFISGKQARDVVLFDRGYPSKALIQYLVEHNIHFLMRAQRSFNRQIDDAPCGETTIQIHCAKGTIPLRLYKFTLPSDIEEMLITTLPDADFSSEQLSMLYKLRWGVETQYDTLKNKLQLERFTCRKWDFILQDFFATLFVSNVLAACAMDSNVLIAQREQAKTYKHPHVVSKNVLIGKLKRYLCRSLAANNPATRAYYLNKVFREAARCYDCVRPDRVSLRRSRRETHHKRLPPTSRSF